MTVMCLRFVNRISGPASELPPGVGPLHRRFSLSTGLDVLAAFKTARSSAAGPDQPLPNFLLLVCLGIKLVRHFDQRVTRLLCEAACCKSTTVASKLPQVSWSPMHTGRTRADWPGRSHFAPAAANSDSHGLTCSTQVAPRRVCYGRFARDVAQLVAS